MAAFGSVPTLLWIAGALAVLLLPAMALIAVWLYGAVFVLSGLAFTHYCLEALQRHRTQALQSPEQPPTPSSLLTQQAA
jgi:cell division protein FtsW (lipid II flippase)